MIKASGFCVNLTPPMRGEAGIPAQRIYKNARRMLVGLPTAILVSEFYEMIRSAKQSY